MNINTYRAFWPFYVDQHRNKTNRNLHFVGTNLAIICAILAVVCRPWFLAAAFVCGYGFAWIGHFFFERNRPATFTYPIWSLRGDFHMLALMWRGRMDAEVKRLN